MKKIIALIPALVLSLVSCTTFNPYGRGIGVPFPVQEPRFEKELEMKTGALIEIQGKEGGYIVGELIAVKKKSLLICEYATGRDLFVDIRDIKTITIGKKSKAMLGAGIGGLIGGGMGALVGAGEKQGSLGIFSKEDNMLIGAAVFGAFGALIGGGIGSIAGIDKTIQIEGKSDSEIKKILGDLSKKARVSDFQ